MQDIEVDVTLTTGKSYSSVLPSDSPLLRDLHVSLAGGRDRANRQSPDILLQLPIDGGHAACSFMSSDVVSIVTRPPVLLQPEQSAQTRQQPAIGNARNGGSLHLSIEDFLTPEENRLLLAYALENEPNFTGSSVVVKEPPKDGATPYRKSRVLFSIKDSPWAGVFSSRLRMHLPHILATLGQPERTFASTEIQLTASNDGDFFKRHADVDHSEKSVASRFLTFVYYFHRTPKPYTGGDILFYETQDEALSPVTAVAPENNMLIAFLSERLHEVDLVQCPTQAFEDSRFTVNGWLRVGP